jgi:hypothetical protein
LNEVPSYDPASQQAAASDNDSTNGFMGRTYLFECSRCGYRARVSGGVDRGRHVAVQTILCIDCKELYDAVIEFKPSSSRENNPKAIPRFAALLNRLPPRGGRRWVKFKLVCPNSVRHRIRLWKQPDKCPKCGTFLEPGPIPFRRWD